MVIWNNSKTILAVVLYSGCGEDVAISKIFWTLRHCAWAFWKPDFLSKCPQPPLPFLHALYRRKMLNFSASCPPPPPLLPDLVPNKLTWELLWFLLSKIHSEDSAKIESLSLYGLLEHFNVQIREWKSHPKIPKVYMKYDVIFIKGSRGPSYPLTIEVRWTPNLSLFKFEFIPHLDTFLFEMQNVTAAYYSI